MIVSEENKEEDFGKPEWLLVRKIAMSNMHSNAILSESVSYLI